MKNLLLNITILGMIFVLIGVGAYTILVELPKEKEAEFLESQTTALLISENDSFTCELLSEKIFAIGLEEFDGADLIRQALLEKQMELQCITEEQGMLVEGWLAP